MHKDFLAKYSRVAGVARSFFGNDQVQKWPTSWPEYTNNIDKSSMHDRMGTGVYRCYDFPLNWIQIRFRNRSIAENPTPSFVMISLWSGPEFGSAIAKRVKNPTPDPDSGIITALVTDSRNPLAQTRMKPVKEVRKYCGFPHHHPPLARNGCKRGQDSLDTTLILEQPWNLMF